jgi:rhodanese-related sulfurtransferase
MSYIVNPKSRRNVKVGSKVWAKLIKEGVIVDTREANEHEICNIPEDADDDTVDEMITSSNEDLPIGQQAVRGRGRYKGKIVKRAMKPTLAEMGQVTTKIASKIVRKKIDEGTLGQEDEDEDDLEKMIWEELLKWGGPVIEADKQNVKLKKGKKFKVKEPEPESESEEEESEEEESEEEDESESE